MKHIELFYEDENLTRDELFEKLYSFTAKDLQGDLFGFGYGIMKIIRNSGWDNPKNLKLQRRVGFQPWLCGLFDKDFEEVKKRRK